MSLFNGLIGNLFVTTNGYLGTSVKEHIGDLVAVPLGAKVPYTLREMKLEFTNYSARSSLTVLFEALKENRRMVEFTVV